MMNWQNNTRFRAEVVALFYRVRVPLPKMSPGPSGRAMMAVINTGYLGNAGGHRVAARLPARPQKIEDPGREVSKRPGKPRFRATII